MIEQSCGNFGVASNLRQLASRSNSRRNNAAIRMNPRRGSLPVLEPEQAKAPAAMWQGLA